MLFFMKLSLHSVRRTKRLITLVLNVGRPFGAKTLSDEDNEVDEEYNDEDIDEGWEEDFDDDS
jgi:hypothetical protein